MGSGRGHPSYPKTYTALPTLMAKQAVPTQVIGGTETDTITACVDIDADDVCDTSETTLTADKTWTTEG